jgi:hypothetical protein
LNFKENKTEIEKILKETFEQKKLSIIKTKELFSFIDPEFFDKSYEDDILVSNQIKKRVLLIVKLIESRIKEKFENEENLIEFQTIKFNFEDYEPIIYIYGYKKEQKNKFKTLPKEIKSNEEFFISLDFIKGFYLLPWS